MNSNIAKAKNNLSYYKRLIESGKALTTKQQTKYEELMNIVKDYQKPVLTEEEKQRVDKDKLNLVIREKIAQLLATEIDEILHDASI